MEDPTQVMPAYLAVAQDAAQSAMATQRAGDSADMPLSARTGRICIRLKLFASLTKFLPEAYRKSREMPVEVDANATIESIIAPLGMPPALVKLVPAGRSASARPDPPGFRRVEFSARQAPGASDNPQTDGFGPLLTLGYVDGDALPLPPGP
jgi:hypothetical protein